MIHYHLNVRAFMYRIGYHTLITYHCDRRPHRKGHYAWILSGIMTLFFLATIISCSENPQAPPPAQQHISDPKKEPTSNRTGTGHRVEVIPRDEMPRDIIDAFRSEFPNASIDLTAKRLFRGSFQNYHIVFKEDGETHYVTYDKSGAKLSEGKVKRNTSSDPGEARGWGGND
jgi:hypothetical protein